MSLPINFPFVIVIPIILQSGTPISSAFLTSEAHKIQYSTFHSYLSNISQSLEIKLHFSWTESKTGNTRGANQASVPFTT